MKTLLKGGQVVSGSTTEKYDVLFENGKILKVAKDIPTDNTKVIDVTDQLIFPGFIDAHTHFGLEVAGTITADGYASGTKSAIAGGTTMIIDFATQYKHESLKQAIDNWHKKAGNDTSCDYAFHLAISDWNENIANELETIVQEGVSSFKLYMTYKDMVLNDSEIYEVLKKIKEVGGIAGVHCENMLLIDSLIAKEKASGHFGCDAHGNSRPDLVEAEAIERLLKIAKLADTPVIIVHLSSAEGFKAAMYARLDGQEVFIETCPQYLTLDNSLYTLPFDEASKYICSPPIRTLHDQDVLWRALKTNQIQTISTDHCSFTTEQKSTGSEDFTKIPNGMPGVETRPSIIYTYGVLGGHITIEQMCKYLSENPAKLYGIYPQKGCLAEGSDADIVVWDTSTNDTIHASTQNSKAGYSPFEGFKVKGKANQVFLRGELIVDDGKVINPGQGLYIKRKTRLPL